MSESSTLDARALLEAARAAREQAYAPYSRFRVGAALLTADGTVIPGCNVENVSYGLTVCAERVAVSNAIAQGHRTFTAVAIATGTAQATPPCGMCRQVLFEFAPDLVVVLPPPEGSEAEPEQVPLREFLPRGFGPSDLSAGIDP
ncbi:MAG: cytidine deaminase [Planctomycetes bacterium]|nr:cytidine deaminase [Planctomycetota bacterium]